MIISPGQTPSKYVTTDNVVMAAKGEKHISQTGSSDKRSITLTLCEFHDGTILPFQLIYKEKKTRSLPNVDFPDGFSCHTIKKTADHLPQFALMTF